MLLLVNILQHMDDATQFDSKEPVEHEEPKSHENLEDLCRSHLVRKKC